MGCQSSKSVTDINDPKDLNPSTPKAPAPEIVDKFAWVDEFLDNVINKSAELLAGCKDPACTGLYTYDYTDIAKYLPERREELKQFVKDANFKAEDLLGHSWYENDGSLSWGAQTQNGKPNGWEFIMMTNSVRMSYVQPPDAPDGINDKVREAVLFQSRQGFFMIQLDGAVVFDIPANKTV